MKRIFERIGGMGRQMKMRMTYDALKRLGFCLLAMAWASCRLVAAESASEVATDPNDPKFVTASVLVMSPGEEIFSCAGHAVIRMECPAHQLDYCFSYESEDAASRLATFFAGKLMMGMFAIPTAEMLESYRKEGREVRQYVLNLPPTVKQRLWKILDDKVAEGANQPYDHIKRGCAWSMLKCILDAVGEGVIEEAPWPAKYDEYQRAIIASSLDDYPWARFAIHAIVGYDTDRDLPKIRKLVIPADCLEYLKGAKIAGVPLIASGDGIVLVPLTAKYSAPWISPMTMAWLVVMLIVCGAWFKWCWLLDCFAALQFLAGCGFTYLIVFSSLPATTWNWLVVPFNPIMPIVAVVAMMKKFRTAKRTLGLGLAGCAAILVAWMGLMLVSPHQLTDPAYIVLTGAFAFMYGYLAWTKLISSVARSEEVDTSL